MNRFLKDYFTFSKRDRIGVISLVVLILLMYLLPFCFTKNQPVISIKEAGIQDVLKRDANPSIDTGGSTGKAHLTYNAPAETHQNTYRLGKLFLFDPNTLNPEGWQKMGLAEKPLKTLLHYRQKGGKFFKKEDLQKIWGLPPGFYERVKNYISIPAPTNKIQIATTHLKKERRSLNLDINLADTASFIALPGIGPVLAARIIRFRNKLGGFYSVNQVGETYGLPDSTFQIIKPYLQKNDYELKKVNINTASLQELRSHPYIKWNVANAIISFRNQHGSFSQVEDLKKISAISLELYEKISPYLSIQ